MTTRIKSFDCVEMKRRGAEKIREKLQGMTREEELAYWARGTEELLDLQRRLRSTEGRSESRSEPSHDDTSGSTR